MHPEFLRLAKSAAWSRGVLIVAAHPDDETIGAGGVLPHLPLLAVARVTDGAPADRRWWGDPSLPSRQAYAEARRAELAAALALAGVGAERIRALGRQDQRAAFDLVALAEDVAGSIDELRPGVVLTHPYEGGHPDHDAAAFVVHAARELAGGDPPVLVEFTSYHAAGEAVVGGEFLSAESRGDSADGYPLEREISILLSPEDRERKGRMLACFASQAETLAQFPVGGAERFRIAPEYDFVRPPHAGALHYERFDWGLTGAEWRALAAEALVALGIGAARC